MALVAEDPLVSLEHVLAVSIGHECIEGLGVVAGRGWLILGWALSGPSDGLQVRRWVPCRINYSAAMTMMDASEGGSRTRRRTDQDITLLAGTERTGDIPAAAARRF